MDIQFPLLLLYFLCIIVIDGEPLVEIQQGKLKGINQMSRNGRSYSAFLGIPYAKPPVGKLRFSNPEPADGWEGTRPATSFRNICPQKKDSKMIGDEDCLFLNVYTPFPHFDSLWTNNTLAPVMVWIHGGGFSTGSSNMFGAEYLLDQEVVLVTINYRLGIFGFFSTGDSASPGNFGMKDQVLALKWVKENIKSFKGDPNRVTIFGESAGGASVSLHAISKASTGLFQQYIIQSGAVFCPWIYKKSSDFELLAKEIAALVLCPIIPAKSLVECMRSKSVDILLEKSAVFETIVKMGQLLWTPTDEPDVEGAFLIDSPKNLVNNHQMKDLPSISGGVTDEGLVVTHGLYSDDELYDLFRLSIDLIIADVGKNYFDVDNLIEFKLAVDKFYFNNTLLLASKDKFLDSITRFFGDGFFLHPQVRMLEKVTPDMSCHHYFYSFGYHGEGKNNGVAHGDEIFYLFPITEDSSNTLNPKSAVADRLISNFMVDLWTTFATNGKPTSHELVHPDLWEPYTTQKPVYLYIRNKEPNGDPTVTLSEEYYTERINFWRENVPIE